MAFNLIDGTDASERLDGTAGRDLIKAGGGDDQVSGWGGNDRVYGEAGDDSVYGQFGRDTLFGGDGNDVLQTAEYDTGSTGLMYGGAGNDQLFAGDKVDYSYGGAGDDQVTLYFDVGGAAYGGAGVDSLVMNYIGSSLNVAGVDYDVSVILNGPGAGATAGPDSMVLAGFEMLTITTYYGDDTVQGGAMADDISVDRGANVVRAMGGNDLVTYKSGQANTLDGGAGLDVLQIYGWEDLDGLTLTRTVDGMGRTDDAGSVITGFERYKIDASFFDDNVQLGNLRDWFRGRDGNDSAQGFAGNDHLAGGDGADSLDGGNGDDVLRGGRDLDVLRGGAGADTFVFGALVTTGDLITDFVSGLDQIALGAGVVGRLLSAGVVQASLFHLDEAVGTGGQFVYLTEPVSGDGQLVWDANGSDAGGALLIATLLGAPAIQATDLTILPLG